MKKCIFYIAALLATLFLLFMPFVLLAAGVTHGWILFDAKIPEENLADASSLLTRINSIFPRPNPFSGKVWQYWMAAPAAVMRNVDITNEFGVVETVATNTGAYIVYVRPSILPLLSSNEQAVVTDVMPEGTFVEVQ